MYYVDQHMHSLVSPDSETSRAEMARAAVERGLSGICFTDHYDILDMDGSYCPTYDWGPARAQQRLALDAWGDRLAIRYGLELGNVPADFTAGDKVLEEPGLDFVICSVHNLSVAAGRTDLYDVSYQSPALCYAHLDDYFQTMLQSALWGRFDILGHIPYPMRYMRERDGQNVALAGYQERIWEILKCVIRQGKGIEVNTQGWSRTVEEDYRWLVKGYLSLGGEIVTVGSDAHAPDRVGAHLPQAYAMLREIGLRYVAVYEGREPHFISLED